MPTPPASRTWPLMTMPGSRVMSTVRSADTPIASALLMSCWPPCQRATYGELGGGLKYSFQEPVGTVMRYRPLLSLSPRDQYCSQDGCHCVHEPATAFTNTP